MSFMHWVVLSMWVAMLVGGTYATRRPDDLFDGWRHGLWAIPLGSSLLFAILFSIAP